METVVGVEGLEEAANVVDRVSGEAGSALISTAAISDANSDPDPVVYKLVRVDGDGRLVPATDDEVLVVGDLLEDEKAEHFVSGTRQPTPCCKTERCSWERTQPSSEENQHIQLDSATNLGIENVQQEETVHQLAPPTNSNDINHPWSIGYSRPGGLSQNASSNPDCAISSEPDFSKLQGEICLDKLSVKELHETFRATFGRETSVKDKQWLKRRISMALTNSCDFSTTTFIIKDNEVVKKGKEENSKTVTDFVVAVANKTVEGPLDGQDNQAKSPSNVDDQKTRSTVLGQDYVTDDPNLESKAAKRIRKPTKRYIEELSEAESGDSRGKLIPQTVKSSEHGRPHLKARIGPVHNVWSDGRPMVTRQDSLGGSGVMVPYVWRIRRSRPRENFMPLMKLQGIGVSKETRMIKKTIGAPETPLEDETDKLLKSRLSPARAQQPLISASEESKHCLERKATEMEKGIELKRMDSFEDNSDDNMISTPAGRMRRKHHRPWSLTEVVKLVEGVAKYGAGRWSEIKRLAFASYSYRTSVDLKDKWRNLLRASSSQLPGEKENTRKHASIPIPAPILMRVRELAQMQPQVQPKLPQSKLTGHTVGSDRSVFETRPGFL